MSEYESYRCTFCGGSAHPATGSVYGDRTIACRSCETDMWKWVERHTRGRPPSRRRGRKAVQGEAVPSFYDAAVKFKKNAVEEKLCESAKWLAAYLETEFDPYDFNYLVPDFLRSRGYRERTEEDYDQLPEDLQAEFVEWAKGEPLNRLMQHDPLGIPSYLYFAQPRVLPAGTWLVHFSRSRFLAFEKGATLETLALSTHVDAKTLKSCDANLDPDTGPYEVVFGFALEAAEVGPFEAREMARSFGKHVMLFQCDCAVKAWHTTDNQNQVIFPLCSEYNVHRGTVDPGGHVTFSFTRESDLEDVEYDSLDEVIEAIGEGTLTPNAYDRAKFEEHLAGLRRKRDEFTERVREEVARTGAFVAPMRDERASLRRTGSYRGWVTITRSTRPGIAWQVTFWEGDPSGPNAVPTGHMDVSGSLDDAAMEIVGMVSRDLA